jgi:hypothetical protein
VLASGARPPPSRDSTTQSFPKAQSKMLWLGTPLTGVGGHLLSQLSNQARDYLLSDHRLVLDVWKGWKGERNSASFVRNKTNL